MSLDQVQDAVSSLEFSEWMAFWGVEAELMRAESESRPRSVDAQVGGWETFVAQHNAQLAGKVNAIAGESGPRRDDGAPRRGVR